VGEYVIGTERLGWPKQRWWTVPFKLLLPVEYQGKLQYEDSPNEPTATCHLQPSPEEPALCGHPWEMLAVLPGRSSWTDLHPEMRCEDCEAAAGIETEDPTGRTYRYSYDDGDEPS
jgi:hypothetical protein